MLFARIEESNFAIVGHHVCYGHRRFTPNSLEGIEHNFDDVCIMQSVRQVMVLISFDDLDEHVYKFEQPDEQQFPTKYPSAAPARKVSSSTYIPIAFASCLDVASELAISAFIDTYTTDSSQALHDAGIRNEKPPESE